MAFAPPGRSRSQPGVPSAARSDGVTGRGAGGSGVVGRSVSPHLTTRTGRGGSSAVQRLVLLEVAAALVVCGWLAGPVALAPAVVAAAALVALALVRRRRRSLPEWLVNSLALRGRRRLAARSTVPPGTDAGFAPAVECDPDLRTYSHARDGEQRPVGLVGDGGFLTVVLQVESDTGALRAERGLRPLPLALVRDVLDVDGIRLESAQVVGHTQAAPAPHLPQQSLVVTNYQRLLAQTAAPAVRIMWIALKLDPELCPEAVAARGGGLPGARRCLVRSADHLSSRLTGAGFRATVLTEEELSAAIATSVCANPMVTVQAAQGEPGEVPRRRTEESADSWRCDNRRHTTYWVRRWPAFDGSAAGPAQWVARLTSVPALATTFSLTLGRGGQQDVTVSGHVRVTGRSSNELAVARDELERAARETRTGLVRLDHEQLPGVLATLPLGGTR
ncbi:type VII secretion protein EccE [Streptomyces galbus]|uniref:Type VII secretion protein EccE n=1 Tax=Streptomyces galbus TaxID=33898 RepID=A0ABX1IXD0_STRGB|nr:type VII secretion protein EccE [Streptomyces galbus]NKQ28847.1 type VII secretion protein EccE [Streptomyces galbus]